MVTKGCHSGGLLRLLRLLHGFGEHQQIFQVRRWSLDQARVGIIKQTAKSVKDLRFGMKIALKLG